MSLRHLLAIHGKRFARQGTSLMNGRRSVLALIFWQVSMMVPAMPECFNRAVFLKQLSSDDNR
jgi:hypothetical protein